ncbi:MAG: hypothetical protein ACHRXM_25795 [Isosphaerales bacterium]
MATIEQLRNATHAVPFQPFTVHLVDGRSYLVKHPDFIALPAPPRGRDLTVHDEDGPHWIDLNLVVELQPAIPGRGRKPKGGT